MGLPFDYEPYIRCQREDWIGWTRTGTGGTLRREKLLGENSSKCQSQLQTLKQFRLSVFSNFSIVSIYYSSYF